MKRTRKVGIVHVPYRIRGGEDVHVAQLIATYQALGYGVVDFVKQLPARSELSAAASSLGAGNASRWNEILQSSQIDFLHVHNIHPTLGPAFLRWISRRQVPALFTIHNHRFYCTNGLALLNGQVCKDCLASVSLWRPIVRNCNSSLAKSAYHSIALSEIRRENLLESAARCFFAPSPYIARELEKSGIGAAKIRLLPPGVDVSSAAQARGSDIFFAARLSEEKGVRCLLNVIPLLPELSFAISGEGPLEAEVKTAADKHRNLRFLGKISRPELLGEMKASRVACVPSICHESYSLLAAEALSLGLQVVMADSESLEHFQPFQAISVNVRDPARLAAALKEAMGRPARSPAETEALRDSLSLARFQERLGKELRELSL